MEQLPLSLPGRNHAHASAVRFANLTVFYQKSGVDPGLHPSASREGAGAVWEGFGPRLAEHLRSEDEEEVDAETLRRWMP